MALIYNQNSQEYTKTQNWCIHREEFQHPQNAQHNRNPMKFVGIFAVFNLHSSTHLSKHMVMNSLNSVNNIAHLIRWFIAKRPFSPQVKNEIKIKLLTEKENMSKQFTKTWDGASTLSLLWPSNIQNLIMC